jgi:hypothetical protein
LAQTETETKLRTKWRLGCTFALGLGIAGVLLATALAYLIFLRKNSEGPLAAWIPEQSDFAVSARLEFKPGSGLESLARQWADLFKAERPADEESPVAKFEEARSFFFYPQVLLLGAIDPDSLEISWAAVANVKRSQRALPAISLKWFKGLLWSEEENQGKKQKRFFHKPSGVTGALIGSQLIVAGDAKWLAKVLESGQGKAPRAALARALDSPAPFSAALDDSQGRVSAALDRFAKSRRNPTVSKAAYRGREVWRSMPSPPGADAELWPAADLARLVIRPREGTPVDEAAAREIAAELREALALIFGEKYPIATAVSNEQDRLGLEILFPGFGDWLLEQASPW